MRQYLNFFTILGLLCLGAGNADAAKRVALVIGNSAYQKVTPLPNPVNDAEAMAAMFNSNGFDKVVYKRDLNVADIRRALRDFADTARDADVAVIYFAGHGIEIDGINYIVPVDATLERDLDAFDEAIPLDRILAIIEPVKQTRLVILDACRENPFTRMQRKSSREVSRGLARIEPATANTLVAYAAKAGSTASDGDTRNSPYTAALMKYLPRPGLDLRKALGFARDEVLRVTNNRQEPYTYGSLGGEDVPLVPGAVPELRPTVGPSPAPDMSNVRRDYELAERVGTKEAWDFFIATYPNGFYANLAKAQRNKLLAKATEPPIVAKSTPEDEAPKRPPPKSDAAFNVLPPRRDPLPSRTLLADMGNKSRWAVGSTSNCYVPKSAYTLEINSGSIVWRNGLGSVNIESIVSSSENELKTTTQTSIQVRSDNVRTGQPWIYVRDGDRIRVQADGHGGFTLFRC